MKKLITFTLICLTTLYSSAQNFYFTQGVEGDDTYTRNWSDLNNWSTTQVSSSSTNIGNVWNTNPATSPVSGVGVNVTFGYNSGKNGDVWHNAGERYVNVDLDNLILSQLYIQYSNNVSDHFTGKDITFQTSNGSGQIINRSAGDASTVFENNIILNSGTNNSKAWNYSVINNFNKDLIFNGNFSMGGDSTGSSYYEILTVKLERSQYTRGNVVFNGAIDFQGRCLVVEQTGTSTNVGKVYVQGAGNNNITLKMRYGAEVVVAKENGYYAAKSYEIYTGSHLYVGAENQFSTSTNIKSTGYSDIKPQISGYLHMQNHDVYLGQITIAGNSALTENITQHFVVDFGSEGVGQVARNFSFTKLTLSGKLDLESSGLVIKNFDFNSDRIFTSDSSDNAATWAEYIYFDGYGEKGVDYNVDAIRNSSNGWDFVIVEVPEVASVAGVISSFIFIFTVFLRKNRK